MILFGFVFRTVYKVSSVPISSSTSNQTFTGEDKFVTITARKNEWRFIPEEIIVNKGDRITLKLVNEDDYEHGFGIDALGVNQRMPVGATVTTQFIADKIGDLPFYCSIACGEGVVDGVKRGHFDQTGVIKVLDK